MFTEPSVTTNNCFKRICWSSIISGALVALGLNFLLGLFGVAIGISTFTLTTDGAIVLAVGGLLGISLGLVATMLASGYTAGYLGRMYAPQRNLGILYGFLTWSLAIILSALLVGHINNYATTFSNVTSRSVFVVPSEKTNTSEPVTVETLPSSMDENHKTIKVTATATSMALSAFTLFGLFALGALASCVGALWGMNCRRID